MKMIFANVNKAQRDLAAAASAHAFFSVNQIESPAIFDGQPDWCWQAIMDMTTFIGCALYTEMVFGSSVPEGKASLTLLETDTKYYTDFLVGRILEETTDHGVAEVVFDCIQSLSHAGRLVILDLVYRGVPVNAVQIATSCERVIAAFGGEVKGDVELIFGTYEGCDEHGATIRPVRSSNVQDLLTSIVKRGEAGMASGLHYKVDFFDTALSMLEANG